MCMVRYSCNHQQAFLRLVLILGVMTLVSGCAQTLRQQYITADDPCSPAREPIVKAGDDLDAQQKELAKQRGAVAMHGQELPEVVNTPTGAQVQFGNIFANALKQAELTNQAYIQLKQQETGANAAAMLASVEGDASNDSTRMKSVTRAMSALRACRQTQIALVNSNTGEDDKNRLEKLRKQQTGLNQDDELIAKVFGQYAARAQTYADASAAAGVTTPAVARSPRRLRSPPPPPRSSVDALKDDEHNAQIADRKQSETLHETLQNSIAGA